MHDLWNKMKSAAVSVDALWGQNRWGTVTSVRSTDQGYDVRVNLQPDDLPSAWLPVLTSFGGAGWGMVARPSVGMQVFLAPDLGDGHHNVVVGMAYSTQAAPPKPTSGFNQQDGTPVGDGELALVSKTGAIVRLCADGTIYIKAPTVNIEGNLNVQGDIHALAGGTGNGDIYDRHGSLDRMRGAYDRHTHTGVRSGPDTSGQTTASDPE